MNTKRILNVAEWLTLITTLAMSILLLSYITLYSDDYQYATFFYDGLKGFWDKTVEHYLTVNGRALVHFFAEVFLIFGTKMYMIVFPFAMALIFYLANNVQNSEQKRISPAVVTVSLCIFLALPVVYLNQTFLWVAGSFNYCFPALLVLGYFAAEKRTINGKGVWLACILGFLSGATTEQNGLMALVGGALIAATTIIRSPSNKKALNSLISLPFTLLGYLSVMLSPGTFSRISYGGENIGVLAVLLNPKLLANRFYSVMAFFCGTGRNMPAASLILVILILLLSFLPLIYPSKRIRPLMFGLPTALVYVLLLVFGSTKLTAGCAQLIVCAYLAFAGVLLLFDQKLVYSGVLIISGLASIGIMIFTNLGAYRTVVPTLIMLIAVTVRLSEEYLSRIQTPCRVSVLALALIVCVLSAIPTFIGYRANNTVILKNEKSISDGLKKGEITLSTDYLDTYRHTLMFEGDYFFTQFKRCYKIPPDTPVHLEGENFSHFPVITETLTFRNHSMMTNSVLYLPMRDIFDYFSTFIYWDFDNGNGFYIDRHGVEYYLSKADNTITRRSDGQVVVDNCFTIGITDRDYIDIDSAAEFFGFEYVFDSQKVSIIY